MQNYIQEGQTLTVVAPNALVSGGGCQVGNIFGVSVNNQNTGDASELVVEGVFDSRQGREHVQSWRQGLLEQRHAAGHVQHADRGWHLQ